MLSFTLRRMVEAVPVLLGVSVVVFLFLHLIPGDPALTMLGERANAENVARVRAQYGLNQPLYVQYAKFVNQLAHADLGRSIRTNRPVIEEARGRFAATIELTVAALLLATVIGVGSGIVSATWRGSLVDHFSRILSLGGVSIPIFWLGLVLIWLFAVRLPWLPSDGRLDAQIKYAPVTNFVLVDALI